VGSVALAFRAWLRQRWRAAVGLRGRGFLTLLAGHRPSGPGQVVLGERTLRAVHRHIGQTVRISPATVLRNE